MLNLNIHRPQLSDLDISGVEPSGESPYFSHLGINGAFGVTDVGPSEGHSIIHLLYSSAHLPPLVILVTRWFFTKLCMDITSREATKPLYV